MKFGLYTGAPFLRRYTKKFKSFVTDLIFPNRKNLAQLRASTRATLITIRVRVLLVAAHFRIAG